MPAAGPDSPLGPLGWDAAWQRIWDDGTTPSPLAPARVSLETKLNYLVWTADDELPAKVTGKLLHDTKHDPQSRPKVGDWVGVTLIEGGTRAQIRRLLPRRTELTRKVAGRRNEAQLLAANLDTVFIVQGLDDNFNLRRLERCLVMVHEGGAQPVVLLNKSDLCPDATQPILAAQSVTGTAPVVSVSAVSGQGLDRLSEWLQPGRTVAFIGSSGVGKSTLINRLFGDEIQDTGEVRERDSKGRHTTTRREMIVLPGGCVVVDTPGMREFHLWFAGDGLDAAFADIDALAASCRFTDCTHTGEPECAVLAAIAAGNLPPERHQNFQRLQGDLTKLQKSHQRRLWQDKAAGNFVKLRPSRPYKRGGR